MSLSFYFFDRECLIYHTDVKPTSSMAHSVVMELSHCTYELFAKKDLYLLARSDASDMLFIGAAHVSVIAAISIASTARLSFLNLSVRIVAEHFVCGSIHYLRWTDFPKIWDGWWVLSDDHRFYPVLFLAFLLVVAILDIGVRMRVGRKDGDVEIVVHDHLIGKFRRFGDFLVAFLLHLVTFQAKQNWDPFRFGFLALGGLRLDVVLMRHDDVCGYRTGVGIGGWHHVHRVRVPWG